MMDSRMLRTKEHLGQHRWTSLWKLLFFALLDKSRFTVECLHFFNFIFLPASCFTHELRSGKRTICTMHWAPV